MHDVNEAYRVLGDPGRRALYDAELRRAASAPPTVGPAAPMSSRPTAEADESRFDLRRSQPNVEPARVPWRMLVTAAAIGVVGVLVLAQLTDPGEEPPPDGILRVGDCVLIEPDNDAREVRCAGDGDLVVRAFVTFDGTCPGLTERHRDQLGMGVACVEAAP